MKFKSLCALTFLAGQVIVEPASAAQSTNPPPKVQRECFRSTPSHEKEKPMRLCLKRDGEIGGRAGQPGDFWPQFLLGACYIGNNTVEVCFDDFLPWDCETAGLRRGNWKARFAWWHRC